MRYNTILWDWNGTLIDDAVTSLNCVNDMLLEMNKPFITLEQYYTYVETPIIGFYRHILSEDELDFSKISKSFHDCYNRRISETFLADKAKDVLHPDGNYPETMFLFADSIYSDLLNKGFKSRQEVVEAYFKSICREKTNPSFELFSGEEKIKSLKSGKLSLKLDNSRRSIKNAFGVIYENGRLKYIASFNEDDEDYLKADFGNVVLDDSNIPNQEGLTISERLERFIYLNQEKDVKAKYVAGQQVLGE